MYLNNIIKRIHFKFTFPQLAVNIEESSFSGKIGDSADRLSSNAGSFERRIDPDKRLRRVVLSTPVLRRSLRLRRSASHQGIAGNLDWAGSPSTSSQLQQQQQQRGFRSRASAGQRWTETLRK